MNSNLILIPTGKMTEEEWLLERQGGLGGSEIGTVMMQNKWESQLELYHRKIGATPLVKHTNESMHWGHQHENTIAKNWEYYDGTIDGMIKRMAQGKEARVRRMRRLNCIVKNPDYPHLLGNIDRLINKGQVMIFDGAILETEGILEIKIVKEWAMKMWEAEVPPMYMLQFYTYMGITGLPYTELAVLKDASSFDVIPFHFKPEIFASILAWTIPFWDRVKRGRFLMAELRHAEMNGGSRYQIEDLKGRLDENEPPFNPQDAIAREQYLNKRYTAEAKVIKGNLEQYEAARKYVTAHDSIKELEETKAHYGSIIKGFMKEYNEMDFGDQGVITWKADKNGTRSLKTTKLVM